MGLFSGISDIFNIASKLVSLVNPAALGAQLFLGAAADIGEQLIQKLGDTFGLPQSVIDMAQAAFCQATGDLDGAVENYEELFAGVLEGLSATDRSAVDRAQNEGVDSLCEYVTDNCINEDGESEEGDGKGSWLVALASVLGQSCQKKADALVDMGAALDSEDTKAVAEFQAMSQEFSMMMNATTSAIKAIGEGMASTARK